MYYIATWFEFMYSLDIVITSLTNDLSHVDRWRQLDHMSINSDKSNVMFISSRQTQNLIQKFHIMIQQVSPAQLLNF